MAERDDIDRREQLLEAAERLVLASGSLNISLNQIADDLGVSRTLIYVYFEGVPQIIDELFARQARNLEAVYDAACASDADFRGRMLQLFQGYLDQQEGRGQLAYLVLRERNQDSPLGAESARLFRRILRKLSRDVVEALKVTPREAFVLIELLASIPEALGRLVRKGQLDSHAAHCTNERLVGAALDTMVVRPG